MKKLTKILRKEEKGFTLIELIVVIAILGIIAAIAVPQYMGTVKNARAKADQASSQTIADAAARYMTDHDGVAPSGGFSTSELETDNYLDDAYAPQEGGTFEISVSGNTITVTPGEGKRTFEIISTTSGS